MCPIMLAQLGSLSWRNRGMELWASSERFAGRSMVAELNCEWSSGSPTLVAEGENDLFVESFKQFLRTHRFRP